MSDHEWDVSLVRGRSNTHLILNIPAPIGKALMEAGMNRAKIVMEEDGILVVPYVGKPDRLVIEIPESWKP